MSSNDILENYDNEEVILLGETHTEDIHSQLEEEAVYRTVPRFVLSEGLDDKDPEVFDERINNADLVSLRGVKRYFEENYEDSEFLAESTENIYETIQEFEKEEELGLERGDIPESYNEFMDMPFFRMNKKVRKKIQDSIKGREDSEFEEYEKWIGEYQPEGIEDDKINDLLAVHSRIYDISNIPNSVGSLIRPINDLRSENFDVDLAGCDINKDAAYTDDSNRNFDRSSSEMSPEEVDRQLEEMEQNPEKTAEDLEKDLSFIQKITSGQEREKRDKAMADRINQFNEINETDRAVLAIVGSNHLEGVSENLERSGVNVHTENLNEMKEPNIGEMEGLQYAIDAARHFVE